VRQHHLARLQSTPDFERQDGCLIVEQRASALFVCQAIWQGDQGGWLDDETLGGGARGHAGHSVA